MEYNHNETLETIKNWINNCDTKISVALAFEVFLLGFLISDDNLKHILNLKKDFDLLRVLMILALVLSFIFLLTSLIYFYRGLKAKTKFNNEYPNENSVLFYGSIASQNFNGYRENVRGITEYELEQDYLSQIHINSVICLNKFKNYNRGLSFLFVSLIPLITYLLLPIII